MMVWYGEMTAMMYTHSGARKERLMQGRGGDGDETKLGLEERRLFIRFPGFKEEGEEEKEG